jgi:hypothetical protein
LEALGIFDVISPAITKYERFGILLPKHFNAAIKKWTMPIVSFTQEEMDRVDEAELDSDETALEDEQREADGILLFNRIRRRVRRMHKNDNLTDLQFRKIRKDLYPVMLGLKQGDWDFVQEDITAMPDFSNAKLLNIQNIVRGKIDDYVLENFV